MDRLTARNNSAGTAYYVKCFEEPCLGMGCDNPNCEQKHKECECLAAYEDTGLTPDKIKANMLLLAAYQNACVEVPTMVISTSQATHNLKTLPPYYDASAAGLKTFEIRLDDRNYRIGDILHLQEWSGNAYTGRSHCKQVTYILRDKPYVPEGYVCMGVIPAPGGVERDD